MPHNEIALLGLVLTLLRKLDDATRKWAPYLNFTGGWDSKPEETETSTIGLLEANAKMQLHKMMEEKKASGATPEAQHELDKCGMRMIQNASVSGKGTAKAWLEIWQAAEPRLCINDYSILPSDKEKWLADFKSGVLFVRNDQGIDVFDKREYAHHQVYKN